jgi:hypothetical protein
MQSKALYSNKGIALRWTSGSGFNKLKGEQIQACHSLRIVLDSAKA